MISEKNDYLHLKDEELVLAAQKGSIDAENEIIKRFTPSIKAAAATYYKEHSSYCDSGLLDIDDLIQEGSLGLLSAIYTFRPEFNVLFRTYASKCTENAFSSAAKSGSAKKHTPPGPVLPYEDIDTLSGSSPEEKLLAEYRCNEILTFLSESLSDKEYAVIRLYLSGVAYKEISEQLKIDEKSVDNTMQRIRAKLRKFLIKNRS